MTSPSITRLPVATDPVAAMTAAMTEGDEGAFCQFYDGYCDRLFRYLIVLTRGDEQRARDLLQTSMLKAVRAIRPFAAEPRLWAWLAAIARNAFFDACRQARRAPALIPLWPDFPADGLAASADTEDQPLVEALDQCLADLDADEREWIESFYRWRRIKSSAQIHNNRFSPSSPTMSCWRYFQTARWPWPRSLPVARSCCGWRPGNRRNPLHEPWFWSAGSWAQCAVEEPWRLPMNRAISECGVRSAELNSEGAKTRSTAF